MIRLEKRIQRQRGGAILAPLLSVGFTFFIAACVFLFYGISPLKGIYTFFISPLSTPFDLASVLIKASPLALIAIGLSFCFRANIWNIGAEGQMIIGGAFAGACALSFSTLPAPFLLLLCLGAGILGGALWAFIPAFLRAKLNTNEILTSLMLVYVAKNILDFLVRGPLRDPYGFGTPASALFESAALLPFLNARLNVHAGLIATVILAICVWFLLDKTIFGYRLAVTGRSLKAAKYSGISRHLTIVVFLLSGAFAGLAGALEVTGVIGQLIPNISNGYGFVAIIVAYLGRLNPLAILAASVVLSLTFVGADSAQREFHTPGGLRELFQATVLFSLLFFDAFMRYKLVFSKKERKMA